MLNNKVDLSKLNTQFVSGSVSPDDSAMEELRVVDDLSTSDIYDKTNNLLSDEAKALALDIASVKAKVDVVKTVLNSLSSMADVTMSLAAQCNGNSLAVEALITYLELNLMITKKGAMEAHPALATFKILDRYIFDGDDFLGEERERPSFTLENGELCYKGVPVHSGTFDDSEEAEETVNIISDTAFDSSIKSASTLDFGTDENGIPNNLRSLLGDINADIKDGGMNSMEAFLEKLNSYENLLLSIQTDLEHKDPAVAITKYKDQETAYQACLAMQPNIVQPTLLDYVS